MKVVGSVLAVLLGLLLLADRVAVEFAEDRVAREVAAQGDLGSAPEVEINGFPFLTQALAGRYDDVGIRLSAGQLGQPEGTRADVTLRGVEAPLSDLLSGTVEALPVERIEGTVTLSYALLSTELGRDTTLEREGDRLRITRTVDVLGREVPLTAVGRVTVQDDEVVIDVDTAEGAGVEVPESLVEQAVKLLDLRYPVPALPFELRLTEITPAEDGVALLVEAGNTVVGAVE